MNDRELLELLKADPHKGLAAVVKQYSAYVYKIVLSRLSADCSREDIEEAVSDIFMRLYTAVQGSDVKINSLCAYLAAIAQRHCINVFKAHLRRTETVSFDELEGALADDITAQADTELIDAIHSLGKPDSEIFIRRYYLTQTAAEIAADLGMKPNTVNKRISRGLKKLKEILKEGEN
ncbi:MAG: sigma-70 family RNA polymerase sigma factor [Ruminococcus sp.]|nr:sigma-70 family RNA polymerase sigma factor [Ruminococcus sp.]